MFLHTPPLHNLARITTISFCRLVLAHRRMETVHDCWTFGILRVPDQFLVAVLPSLYGSASAD